MPTENKKMTAAELLHNIRRLDENEIDAVLAGEGIDAQKAVANLRARMTAALGGSVEDAEDDQQIQRSHRRDVSNADHEKENMAAPLPNHDRSEKDLGWEVVALHKMGSLNNHATRQPQLGHLSSSTPKIEFLCYVFDALEILRACEISDHEHSIAGQVSLMFRVLGRKEVISLKANSTIRNSAGQPLRLFFRLTDSFGNDVKIALDSNNSARLVKKPNLRLPIEKTHIDVGIDVSS